MLRKSKSLRNLRNNQMAEVIEKTKFNPIVATNKKFIADNDEQQLLDYMKKRKEELKGHRKNIGGVDVNTIWNEADKRYIPHKLKGGKSKKMLASNDENGWRSAFIEVGQDGWQSDTADIDLFVKIQVALAILLKRVPEATFKASKKQYKKLNAIIKAVYKKGWEKGKAMQQLKLFVFNLAKYGFSVARTYPKMLKSTNEVLTGFDDKGKKVYETREVIEYNDIARKNLNPKRAWIDELAIPNAPDSAGDWMWEEDYTDQALLAEFSDSPNIDFVQPATSQGSSTDDNEGDTGKKVEAPVHVVTFYESKVADTFAAITDSGVVLVNEPLPISDNKGIKKLSCWYTYWNLRNAESIEGIGLYEILKNDSETYDKLRNMTVDQLVMSIYKMFFYSGTNQGDSDGNIKITPGKGQQVNDPKNMKFLEVPGPGQEAWKGLEFVQNRKDEISGITKPLLASVTEKNRTAFEVGQAKESALQRLSTPLENIKDAIEQEAYIALPVMGMIYSIPEVIAIADKQLINDYLEEIQGDGELFERGENGEFLAKVYQEMSLNIETDDDGQLIESKEDAFFSLKPSVWSWEGTITVKAHSLINPSPIIERQESVQLSQILFPMFQAPPEIGLKLAKEILKKYDEDPKDWLPDTWLAYEAQGGVAGQQNGLFVPQGEELGNPSEEANKPATSPNNGAKLPNDAEGLIKSYSQSVTPK